jgi:hypothetical protein
LNLTGAPRCRLGERNAESLFYAALVELAAEDREAVVTLLEEAMRRDESYRQLIGIEPAFAGLSQDARFRAVIGSPD